MGKRLVRFSEPKIITSKPIKTGYNVVYGKPVIHVASRINSCKHCGGTGNLFGGMACPMCRNR